MLSYITIDGGYQILSGDQIICHQPFNPATGTAYSESDAIAAAKFYIDDSIKPDKLTILDLIESKDRTIRAEGAKRLNLIAAPYLQEERSTWAMQLAEAELFIKDKTSATPMLSVLADKRGLNIENLIGKVIENANLFRSASGAILGEQQLLLDKLYSLGDSATESQIAEISWS